MKKDMKRFLIYKWWKQFLIGHFYDIYYKGRWIQQDGFKTRKYRNYDEYIKVQQAKLKYEDLTEYDKKFYSMLFNRIWNIKEIKGKQNVLCLAARIGTEVRAFRDNGFFAWGVDLNPGKKNSYVVHGDFHSIPLHNNCVDIIYSNSLDHSFNLSKVLIEIKRILNKDGVFILEVGRGYKKGGSYGLHEAIYWEDIGWLKRLLYNNGFKLIRQYSFTNPYECFGLVIKKC